MLRKSKRLPVMIMPVLIIVFLGSLFGCGDNPADPLETGTIQFYNATGAVITSVTIEPGGTLTLIVKVKNSRSDGTLAPVIGETVTFTLVTPGNGGGLTVVNDRTAGDGQAMAIYTAGNTFATDSVRATTSTGATATITIAKTGTVGAYSIAVTAGSLTAIGGSSAITATVETTITTGKTPVMGVTVNFTQTGGVSVLPASATTDGSGNARAVFTGGGGAALETAGVVTASITIGGNTYTAVVVITNP